LTSLAPTSNFGSRQAPNPAVVAAASSPLGGSKTPKDRMVNMQVVVVKGEFKGYMGTVKDTNGNTARVELATNRKVISIDKGKLRRKKCALIVCVHATNLTLTGLVPILVHWRK
jgi:transcription elongation factor SPT5